ncbi:hypothetical protein CTI14_59505, partial [Methylobacterium radiotolerans]
DADLLRRAMGSKRGVEKIGSLKEKLFAGMAANADTRGVEGDLHPDRGVADFGFAESLQMAMAIGGCTAEDADLLRRAMGSKRGVEKIGSLKEKLFAGMAAN